MASHCGESHSVPYYCVIFILDKVAMEQDFHRVSSTLPCQWLPWPGRTLLHPWSLSLLGCETMQFGRIHTFMRNPLPPPWGQQSELAASNFKVELFYFEDWWSRCLLNLVSYQTTWCHIPGNQNLGSPLWEPPTTPSYIIHLIIYTCRCKYCMDVHSLIIWQILAHEICFPSITVKGLKLYLW
jgi:hypothetical protein